MGRMNEILMEYPATVVVGDMPAPARLERIEAALNGLDYVRFTERIEGAPRLTYRFRAERDVTVFQDRLAR